MIAQWHRGEVTAVEAGCLDQSIASKGVAVIFRDGQYKKNIRLLVSPCLVVANPDDTDKLIRKLDKHITRYFNHQYLTDDFMLSGANFICDIDVGNRKNVADYYENPAENRQG